MNPSRLTIRARITGGSLIIAMLISIIAGIVIFAQVQRIVSNSQTQLLDSVQGPYLAALHAKGDPQVEPPGAGQLVAVVSPKGARAIDTLPVDLSDMLGSLLRRVDGTRNTTAGSQSFLVRITRVDRADGTWSVVTASRNDVGGTVLNSVAFLLVASIAGINLAFGAASWFIGAAALKPVARLRRSAADLAVKPGDELLPIGPARDEISELAVTLNELITQLRASAERERQIVANASHEFRTPLAIIQTQLELAQRQATSLEQMQEDVTAAQVTLARLSGLASSMLELSRIDTQGVPGLSTTSGLALELADAADRGRIRVGHRDIRVEYSTDADLPARHVAVSEADFGRVCDNLINNALAVIEQSGVVDLTLSMRGDSLILWVSDNGPGMADDFVPLAFDRFSRSDPSRTGGGAGLGLSIVAGIVALAGGEVDLHNQPGIGLTVEVAFPTIAG
jgi:signal transduction histidine kinase